MIKLIPVFLIVLVLAAVVAYQSQSVRPIPRAAGGTIDTLPYLIGKHAIGQSQDPKNNGITNYVVGNSAFFVKNSSGTQYEYRTWDNNYIYLKQDTSVGGLTIKGKTPNSYTFGSGIWLKRHMTPGEVITVYPGITWFQSCQKIEDDWSSWNYKVSISGPTRYNVGGDLGSQEVIIMKYDYLSGYELFYYSKDWGWVRWEEWDVESKTMKRFVNFNRILSSLWPVKASCGTPQPRVTLPPPPTPSPSPTPPPPPPASSTHKACRNNSCALVTGSGTDECSTVGESCGNEPPQNALKGCQGADDARCFDCNADFEINILDFSCFNSHYGKRI